MDEPVGRFGAAHTINRGLQEAPVLRQGLGLTWFLAAVGATGGVVVPILLQQAIDKGVTDEGVVRVGFVGVLVGDRRGRPPDRRRRPAHGRRAGSGGAASRRCSSCEPA